MEGAFTVYSPEHVALLCLPGTKVFVMPNGMLKSNQQLVDIIEKVKPEIRLLIEKCNTVRHGLVTYDWTQIAPLDLWNEGWGWQVKSLDYFVSDICPSCTSWL